MANIDALGMSFRDFMKGELPALPGELPQLSDWADHLTTAFPEARGRNTSKCAGLMVALAQALRAACVLGALL